MENSNTRNTEVKEIASPGKNLQKSLKNAFKTYFSSKKADDTEEPELADQVSYIKQKISSQNVEINSLLTQKDKVLVQLNQLKYSSDYLLKNLFKDLEECP